MRTSHTATDVGTMVRVPKKGNSTGNYQQWILIWGLFPLCAVDTESLWMACLHKSAVPQKDFLASNFLCLFYFFVSKLELFTRPPWEWQSNVDETKYPAFIDKTSRREWVYAFACVSVFARKGFHNFEVLTSAAGPSRDGMWYSPLHKGPWPL